MDCGSRVTLQHFGVPKMYAYSSRRSPWSLGHRVFVGKKKLRFVRFRHEPSETWCLFSGQGKAVGTLHSLKKKNLSLSLVCSSGGTFKEPLYVMSAQFFFFFFFQENLPLESFQLIPEQLIWLRVKVTSSHFISDLSKYLLYSFEVQTKHYLERYLQTFDGQYK